jgi:hypothetical protein
LKLYFEKIYIAEKSKDVEIVFSIPKAKSGTISIKIKQPSLWTDPYLPDLILVMYVACQKIGKKRRKTKKTEKREK